MAEPFLEEQLKRIKDMTEQMSRIRALRDPYELRTPRVSRELCPSRFGSATAANITRTVAAEREIVWRWRPHALRFASPY